MVLAALGQESLAQTITSPNPPTGTTITTAVCDSRALSLMSNGQTITFSNTAFTANSCLTYGVSTTLAVISNSIPSANTCAYNNVTFQAAYSGGSPSVATNLAGGVAVYTGTTLYRRYTSGTSYADGTMNVRMILNFTTTGGTPLPITQVGSLLLAPVTGNFRVQIRLQAQGPTATPYVYATSGTGTTANPCTPNVAIPTCANYGSTFGPALHAYNCLSTDMNYKLCTQFPGGDFYTPTASATAPTITSGPANNSASTTNSVTYGWSGTLGMHPLSRYQYRINSGSWTNAANNGTATSQTITLPNIGANTFCVRYYDGCNNTYYPSTAGVCRTVYYTPVNSCGNTVNWGGNDWTISASTTVSGIHTNVGNFTVNSGVTATVATGCELNIDAANVSIVGIIDAIGAGNAGSSGGAGGTNGSNLHCDANAQAWASGGTRATSAGSGTGGGNFPASNGSNGVGCGQDCTAGDDYAGAVRGGGGAGGGGGGAYGGAGSAGGTGGTAGWYQGYAVWNNGYCGTPFGGGGGSSGGSGGLAYGNNSDYVIDFGSGGAGGGGGGRGGNNGGAGGAGGRGGGKITLTSRENIPAPHTFTLSGQILANGAAGGTGGAGGHGNRTASNCCGDLCDQRDVEEANTVSGAGGGAGGGGGSGGGVMLFIHGNSNLTGTVQANGGNGGGGGAGGNLIYGSYTGGCTNTWVQGDAGAAGGSGGKGGGGRIKIFRNPCYTHTGNPTLTAAAGASGNGTAGAGTTHIGNLSTYTALAAGTSPTASYTICNNISPATGFSAGVSTGGTGAYLYQWYVTRTACGTPTTGTGSNANAGWAAIAGVTGQNMTAANVLSGVNTVGNITTAGTYCFQRRTQSGECYVWTGTVTLTILPAVNRGTVASGNETICNGGDPANITMSTAPSGGAGTFNYQWYYQNGSVTCPTGTGTSGWTAISGETSASYDPPSGLTGTRTYAVTVDPTGSPDCGGAEWASSCRVVTVVNDPLLSAPTANTDICPGENVSLTSDLTGGTGTQSPVWQYSSNGTVWNNITANGTPTGASYGSSWTAATLTANGITAPGVHYFRRNLDVTGAGCNATSAVATITVNPIQVNATSGTTGPTYYTNLQAAFNAINAGTHAGDVTIRVNCSVTHNATAALNASGSGSANYASVSIFPTANVTLSGGVNGPLVNLNGADHVTIDGRLNGTGATKQLTIANTNASTGVGNSTIRLTEGAQYNIIRDLVLKSSSTATNANGGGVISFHNPAASTATTGNNNNVIRNNDITANNANGVVCGIISQIALTGGGTGNENADNSIIDNNIFDVWRPNSTTQAILLNTNSKGWTVTGNSIYHTTTYAPTAINISPRGIQVNSGTANGGFNISGNFIGGSAPGCGGSALNMVSATPFFMYGIVANSSNGTVSSMQGNTIANIFYESRNVSGFRGIQIDAGSWNVGTVSGNTVGSATGNGNITLRAPFVASEQVVPVGTVNISAGAVTGISLSTNTAVYTTAPTVTITPSDGGGTNATATAVLAANGTIGSFNITNGGTLYTAATVSFTAPPAITGLISYGILLNGTGTLDVRNNRVASINVEGSATNPHSFYGIFRNSGIGAFTTISNNHVGSATANSIRCVSTSTAAAQSLHGIRANTNSPVTMSGNIVENLHNGYTDTGNGLTIGVDAVNGSNVITDNIIRNVSTASAGVGTTSNSQLQGIRLATTTAGTVQNISGNEIHGLTSSNGSAAVHVTGIYFGGLAAGAHTISKNFVHSISVNSNSASAAVFGIRMNTGSPRLSNNIINVGEGCANGTQIFGIWEPSVAGNAVEVVNNTVRVSGSTTNTTSLTYAMYSNGTATPTRNFRNNIFDNARSSSSGSNLHFAIRVHNATNLTIDHNDYNASGTGGTLGRFNTTARPTLALWQTSTGQDAYSYGVAPVYSTEPPTTLATHYRPDCGLKGTAIPAVPDDYAGALRSDPPTMGAWEATTMGAITVEGTTPPSYGCYPNLRLAFASINDGVHKGTITVKVHQSITDNNVAVLFENGYNGTASYTGVLVYPTVSGLMLNGNVAGATIDLNGADNVTIDGRVNATGTTRDLVVRNTSVATSASNVRLVNSAENNLVQYCKVEGRTRATTGGALVFFHNSIGGGNGNSGNTITQNEIYGYDPVVANRPMNALYSNGTVTSPNANNIISNNLFYDFFRQGATSYGVRVGAGSTKWAVSNNHFFESTGFAATGGHSYLPIEVSSADGNGFLISGNFIGGSAPSTAGSPLSITGSPASILYGIRVNSTATGDSTIILNNTIANLVHESSRTLSSNVGAFQGILVQGAGDVRIEGNVVNNVSTTKMSPAGVTRASGISRGIAVAGTGGRLIKGNTVSGITAHAELSVIGHTVYGVHSIDAAPRVISGNTVGSPSVTNSVISTSICDSALTQIIYGILSTSNAVVDISGNTVANLTNDVISTAASFTRGIHVTSGTNTISGNTVHGLSTASAYANTSTANGILVGIQNQSAVAGASQIIRGNTVCSLSQTHPSAAVKVRGIHLQAASDGSHIVQKNFVHSLTAASSNGSAQVWGMHLASGSAAVNNNIINVGTGVNNGNLIYGISEAGTEGNNYDIDHNTVRVSGSTSNGTILTYAMFSNGTANIKNIRNNIFDNARSSGSGSNLNFAIRLTGNTGVTIDHNDYFVSGTAGTLGRFNTTARPTLALWQTSTTQDANSFNLNPTYSTVPPTILPAHYVPLCGMNGASALVADDHGGAARATIPSIGAWEVTPRVPIVSNMIDWTCSGASFSVTPLNTVNGFIPVGTTYTWPAPSGSGFTGGVPGAGPPITGNLTNTTAGDVVATYIVTPTAATCVGDTFTVAMTVAGPQSTSTWTGNIDTDWFKHGNWTFCVPVPVTDAIVPNTTNKPVIATSLTGQCKTITLHTDDGARLDILGTGGLDVHSP